MGRAERYDLPVSGPVQDLPIDHVAFATRDLAEAQDRLAVLGLAHTPVAEARWPSPDGPHRARTVSVLLEDGYLDVIELPAAEAVLEPTGVVRRAEDLAAERERLMAAGVRCGTPYTIVRRFEGAGPDQRYEIFGVEPRHACGLPQSVISTLPAEPMSNRAEHRAWTRTVREAVALLDLGLGLHED